MLILPAFLFERLAKVIIVGSYLMDCMIGNELNTIGFEFGRGF